MVAAASDSGLLSPRSSSSEEGGWSIEENVTSPVLTDAGCSLTVLLPFEDQEETEIDEEYWRKYPDLKPGSMARALTEAEVDSLHRELTETVAGFKDEDLPSWNIHGVLRSPSSF